MTTFHHDPHPDLLAALKAKVDAATVLPEAMTRMNDELARALRQERTHGGHGCALVSLYDLRALIEAYGTSMIIARALTDEAAIERAVNTYIIGVERFNKKTGNMRPYIEAQRHGMWCVICALIEGAE